MATVVAPTGFGGVEVVAPVSVVDRLSVVVVNSAGVQPPGLDEFAPRVCVDVDDVAGDEDVVILYARRPGADAHRLASTVSWTAGSRLCAIASGLDAADVVQAFEAGVTSYLILGEWSGSMAGAVRCTAQDMGVATRSVSSVLRARIAPPGEDPAALMREQLSPRERSIMEMLARGQDTTGIATDLSLSRQTVRNHLASIFAKLNVHGQSQAILRWLGHEPGR